MKKLPLTVLCVSTVILISWHVMTKGTYYTFPVLMWQP